MTQDISSRYEINIYTPDGDLLADVTGLAQLRNLHVKRNRGGYAEFDIDLDVLEKYCYDINIKPFEIFNININEVRIKRGTRDLWGGQLSYALPSIGDRKFTVKAIGFFDLLKNRYTASERVFTSTDAGQIAKTLIDETQALSNGDFGIVTDNAYIESTVSRDRTYSYDEVYEKIVQLSEVIDGFDFEFTPDKKFYVYASQGIDLSTIVKFEYPGNIKNIEFERNGEDMINQAIVFGNGINVTRSDTTYQSVYKLRQKKFDFPSIINTTPLENHGDEELRNGKYYKDLVTGLTIDGNQQPYIGSYWIGDRIRTIVNGYQSFEPINNALYRIDEIEINIDQNLSEEINLSLSYE